MKKFLIVILSIILIVGGPFGLFMLALISWGYEIGISDQNEELLTFAAIIFIPVVPLVIWYIIEAISPAKKD